MKLFLDFLPIVVFFVAYFLPENRADAIYIATAAAIVAGVVQVALTWLLTRQVERMHLVTLGLLVFFGGLTLLMRDSRFIMWKPTAVNWLFAAVFAGSHFIGRKPLIRRMMEANVTLRDAIWTRLSLGWVTFFFALGAINLVVAYNFDEATWVQFKLFGMLGLTILFVIAQSLYLVRHIEQPADSER